MRAAIRRRQWLLLLPLVMLGGKLVAQAPPREDEPDRTRAPARETDGLPKLKLPALLAAKPVKAEAGDDELRKLLKARYNEAVAEVNVLYELYRAGAVEPGSARPVTSESLFEGCQRLVRAGLELFDKPAERVALLTQYVELSREAEKLAEARHRSGTLSRMWLHQVRYRRLDAEIQLLRYKRSQQREGR